MCVCRERRTCRQTQRETHVQTDTETDTETDMCSLLSITLANISFPKNSRYCFSLITAFFMVNLKEH